MSVSIRLPLSNDLFLLIFNDLSIMDLSGEIHGQSDDLRLSISPFLRDEEDIYGKSTRENKNIFQQCREAQGLTREKASENMVGVSASRIEKIEYDLQEPTPYDIIQMADCYKRPDLCNYYCSHKCMIGDRYVPEVEV